MADPLFITQSKLEEWIEEGEVLFEDNTLTIFAQNVSYQLEPAIRVISILDGSDEREWMGRVLLVAEVQAQGAEHLNDSVIIGNTAYQCEEGFVGQSGQQPVAVSAAPTEAAAAQASADAQAVESLDLLADFLLKHL